jgi:hypothetical protein
MRENRITKQEITQQDKRGLQQGIVFLIYEKRMKRTEELQESKSEHFTWYFNLKLV